MNTGTIREQSVDLNRAVVLIIMQKLQQLGGVPTLVNRIFLKHFCGCFVVRSFFRVVFEVAHKLRRVLPRPENSVARGYNYFFVITHFVSPFVFCYYARYAAEKYRRRVYKICPAAEN